MKHEVEDTLGRRRFLQWAVLGSAALLVNVACEGDDPIAPIPESESDDAQSRADVDVSRVTQGSSRDPSRMAGALRHELEYLDLDRAGVDRYCGDYVRHVGAAYLDEREFYSRFLLSSDFFRKGADESRRVHYVAFYDPYVIGCPNPFAQLDPA